MRPYIYFLLLIDLEIYFNKPIQSVQEFKRPLSTSFGQTFNNGLDKIGINHRGQVITFTDGHKFLAHKVSDFGQDSQTVVVDAKYTYVK